MSLLKRGAALLLTAAVMCSAAGASAVSADDEEVYKIPVSINSPTFRKLSSRKIRLYWSGAKDDRVRLYIIQRCDLSTGKWRNIGKIASDGDRTNGRNYFTDILKTTNHQRYRYRIRVRVSDTEKYLPAAGKDIYASNVKVCIDPGHFKKQNGGTYGYTEAEAVLQTGLYLRSVLKNNGIDVYMTRDDENIDVGGSTNTDDGNQLYARGACAYYNKCDLFMSLHTNANSSNANGCDTLDQPKNINKTIVFVNRIAAAGSGKSVRKIANYIGRNITKVNRDHGIYCCAWKTGSNPTVYTDDRAYMEYNDGLNQKGMLIYRKWGSEDYYAVLRGAADYGVPGMLIEHAYHTYPGFCEAFVNDSSVAADYAVEETKGILKYFF